MLVVLTVALVGMALWAVGEWSEEKNARKESRVDRELKVGEKIEVVPEPGQVDRYLLSLEADWFFVVEVEQLGVDVVIRLFSPAGELMSEVDSPTGTSGVERLVALAQVPGEYRIEVEAFSGGEPGGRYAIELEEAGPADEDDRTDAAAADLFARGDVTRRDKDFRRARGLYRQAADRWESIGRTRQVAMAAYRIGLVSQALEDPATAADEYERALQLGEGWLDPRLEAAIRIRWTATLRGAGRLEKAVIAARGATGLAQETGNDQLQGNAWYERGVAHHWLGHSGAAMEALDRAADLLAADSEGLAKVRLELAGVHRDKADFAMALQLLEEILGRDRSSSTEATARQKMGEILTQQGNYSEARRQLDRSLEIFGELERERPEAIVLLSLGTLALNEDRHAEARERFERALDIFRRIDDTGGEAMAIHKLGRYYFAEDQLDRALEQHRRALQLFEHMADDQNSISCRFGIGRALYHQGDLTGAHQELQEVVQATRSLRERSSGERLRDRYTASRRHYWDYWIATLMALHREEPGDGYDLLALQATEQWRAQSLREMLALAQVDTGVGITPERRAQMRLLSDRLDRTTRARLGEGDPEKVRDYKEREARLVQQLAREQGQIRHLRERDLRIEREDPLDLGHLREQILKPKAGVDEEPNLLLSFYLGEVGSFLWAIGDLEITSYDLGPRSEIETLASQYHRALSSRVDDSDRALGQELAGRLLGPLETLEDLDDIARLVVIPDGALHYIPFGSLPLPASLQPRGDEIVLDRYEVVHLPSASVVAELRKTLRQRPPAKHTLAMIADPVFASRDPRVEGGAREDRVEPRLDRDVRRVLRELDLDRLEHTAREAETILRLVPEQARLSARGFEANHALVDSGILSDYRIVHFATHALVNDEHPELSSLVLSLIDREGRPATRGLIQLHDLYGLDLRADLAVLSACRTGLGTELGGEGLVGLSRGFFYAGVPRLIHSLWDVGDSGTAELMIRFYQAMLTDNLRPAAALRRAQLSMRREEEWRDPYHWAGFVFQGDWVLPVALDDGWMEPADEGDAPADQAARAGEDLPVGPGEPPSALSGLRPDGKYAYHRPSDFALGRWFVPDPPDHVRSRFWAPKEGVEIDALDSAGWGVVYPPGQRKKYEALLEPLLARRRAQAGEDRFREIVLLPQESYRNFLSRHGENLGAADPENLPYYLLLVGSPEDIPFDFQSRLDQIYAVGRLYFDNPVGYRSYAESVVECEISSDETMARTAGNVVLFCPTSSDDRPTLDMRDQVAEPLRKALKEILRDREDWQFQAFLDTEADRVRLLELLSGQAAPDLLLTIGHGLVLEPGHPEQRARQGALVCSDWPGPKHSRGVAPSHVVAADDLDLEGQRPLLGAVSLHLACHSGGSPQYDSFEPLGRMRRRLADQPFVAALPQRLLGQAGALAVLAHVDRSWTRSFEWRDAKGESDPGVFRELSNCLLDGKRVGEATEQLAQLYSKLSDHVTERWGRPGDGSPPDEAALARDWRIYRDIGSFVLFGDPAVRLGRRNSLRPGLSSQ